MNNNTQFKFTKKEKPFIPVEIGGQYIELEINTGAGELMEAVGKAEVIQLNSKINKDRIAYTKEFIEIAKILYGQEQYDLYIKNLSLEDFTNLMTFTIQEHVYPLIKESDQNKNFKPETYTKPFEIL